MLQVERISITTCIFSTFFLEFPLHKEHGAISLRIRDVMSRELLN